MLLENLGPARRGARRRSRRRRTSFARLRPRAAARARAPRRPPAARASGGGGRRPRLGADDAVRGLHRFSLLLERLEAQGGLAEAGGAASAAPAAAPRPRGRASAQAAAAALAGANEALAFAARSSHSGQELEAYLARLKDLGLEAGTGQRLPRALADAAGLGDADDGPPGAGAPAAPPESGALGAMRRIITGRRRSGRDGPALPGDGQGRHRALQRGLAARRRSPCSSSPSA